MVLYRLYHGIADGMSGAWARPVPGTLSRRLDRERSRAAVTRARRVCAATSVYVSIHTSRRIVEQNRATVCVP